MRRWVLAVLAFLSSGAPALAGEEASFRGVGDLPGGGFESRAFDVSSDGSVVVGVSRSELSETFLSPPRLEPFVWEDGEMRSLGPVEPWQPLGYGRAVVSGDGSTLFAAGQGYIFRWTEETGFQRIPAPTPTGGASFVESRPYAVSFDGSVVTGDVDAGAPFAFRWTPSSGFAFLEPMDHWPVARGITADGRTIVGRSGRLFDGVPTEVFGAARWDDGVPGGIVDESGSIDLPSSIASDITPDGSVVIGLTNDRQVLRWRDGEVRILFTPRPFADEFQKVAGDGWVIVWTWREVDFSESEAYVWDPAGGERPLADLLTGLGLDLTGWTLDRVEAISDDGRTLVGTGTNPDGLTEGWVAVLPPGCSNTLDDDGDGLVDFPDDPGCVHALGFENPQCDDGDDNDGDGLVDFGQDPECTAAAQNREAACGLGAELVLAPTPLLWLQRRCRRRGAVARVEP